MNQKYNEGRAATATGGVDLGSDGIALIAVNDSYVFDADHTAADLASAVVGGAPLLNQSVDSEGRFLSDPAVFTDTGSIGAGDTAAGLVLVDETAEVLIAFYDTLAGDQPVDIVGDGTDKTVEPPLEGWLRV